VRVLSRKLGEWKIEISYSLIPEIASRGWRKRFREELYDGSSQPQVVDLGKSATRLGKARRSVLNPINNVLNFRFITE
jgi:hypothetical protein